MSAPATTGYLLDTNILVFLIRASPVGTAIAAKFGLTSAMNRCAISVITIGEMHSLARRWSWGTQKVSMWQSLLAQVVAIDINHPAILEAYGELDNASNRLGRPMGKNDVWIAATAKVSGLTLLTADADFRHLCPVHFAQILVDSKTGNPIP